MREKKVDGSHDARREQAEIPIGWCYSGALENCVPKCKRQERERNEIHAALTKATAEGAVSCEEWAGAYACRLLCAASTVGSEGQHSQTN